MTAVLALLVTIAASALIESSAHPSSKGQRPEYTRILALHNDETVFAYARISPNGQFLVYSSQVYQSAGYRSARIMKLVDLRTGRILFREPGIDGYWSPDGERVVFVSLLNGPNVSILEPDSGYIARAVAPVDLGDYHSWGNQDGTDIVLTIRGYYFTIASNRAVLPPQTIVDCPDIGRGDRPLLSKDARRVTVFWKGTLLVRNIADCDDIVYTHLRGAKADFSWNGRYIAFHAPKPSLKGYHIEVVDLQRRTKRSLTDLPGSSYFPSWTRDDRLAFRYEGPEFRGFMLVDNVFSIPERALTAGTRESANVGWRELFPTTGIPGGRLSLVLLWAPWSAHSSDALLALQEAWRSFAREADGVSVFAAHDPMSNAEEAERMRGEYRIDVPQIPLTAERLIHTEALNQVPLLLAFRDGKLIGRRLGALTAEEIREWIAELRPRPQRKHG